MSGADGYGYIRVSRKLYETCPFWNERREFSRHEAWEDMLQMAAWKEHQRSVNGSVVTLARGEFLASIRFLARRWLWSRSRVSRFLKVVADMNRIRATSRTTEGDIYLLVNYDAYQSNGDSKRDTNRDSGGTAAGQRRDKENTSKASKASKASIGTTPTESAGKPPSPQQVRVQRVVDVIPSIPFGLAGKLLKEWEQHGDDALISALEAAVECYPVEGYKYILQTIATARRNGGRFKGPSVTRPKPERMTAGKEQTYGDLG